MKLFPHSLFPTPHSLLSSIRNPQSSAPGFIFHDERRRVNLTTVRRILPRACDFRIFPRLKRRKRLILNIVNFVFGWRRSCDGLEAEKREI